MIVGLLFFYCVYARISRHYVVLGERAEMLTNDRMCDGHISLYSRCMQLMPGCKLEHRLYDSISVETNDSSRLHIVNGYWDQSWECHSEGETFLVTVTHPYSKSLEWWLLTDPVYNLTYRDLSRESIFQRVEGQCSN